MRIGGAYVHYQLNTTNISFVKIASLYKSKGIKNYMFMLQLNDPDLMNVDPHDPNLTPLMKAKIVKECVNNYWYFIREVVILNVSGGTTRFRADRGNMASSYCLVNNLKIFVEQPKMSGPCI